MIFQRHVRTLSQGMGKAARRWTARRNNQFSAGPALSRDVDAIQVLRGLLPGLRIEVQRFVYRKLNTRLIPTLHRQRAERILHANRTAGCKIEMLRCGNPDRSRCVSIRTQLCERAETENEYRQPVDHILTL